MRTKNTFFKLLDKLENVKISPVWGYSFAVCLILYATGLVIAQCDVSFGGGEFIPLWSDMSVILWWVAIILFALIKKSKRYGMKISRIFAIAFVFISIQLSRLIPSNPQMHGDCYFDPMDLIEYLIFIVAGFVGYAVGKYIAKKIENCNMASVKIESSQG